MDHEARFRQLALSLPKAVESSHMGVSDFRAHNRIFATLAYVARGLATLKLTPAQQQAFLADLPEFAEPAAGGWGRMGMTLLRLDAPEDILRGALLAAYNNVKPKPASSKPKPKVRPSPRSSPRKPRA